MLKHISQGKLGHSFIKLTNLDILCGSLIRSYNSHTDNTKHLQKPLAIQMLYSCI